MNEARAHIAQWTSVPSDVHVIKRPCPAQQGYEFLRQESGELPFSALVSTLTASWGIPTTAANL